MAANELFEPSVSPIRVAPTPIGKAVLFAAAFLFVMASQRGVAIGLFIPLVLLALVDFVIAANAVRRAPVSVRSVRTIVGSPDGFTVALSRESGWATTLVDNLRFAPIDDRLTEVVLPRTGEPTLVELADGHPRAIRYLRFRVRSTTFGLVDATRWEVHPQPGLLARAAAPKPYDLQLDLGVDVSRLREYVPGDRMSRVSWPATARTGVMHVRGDDRSGDEVTVVVDLGMGEGANRVSQLSSTLEIASNAIGSLLVSGTTVRLIARKAPDAFFAFELESALSNPRRHVRLTELPPTEILDTLLTDELDLIANLAICETGPPVPRPNGSYLLVDSRGLRIQ